MNQIIEEVVTKIRYKIIDGITIEINDFFNSLSDIKMFKFNKEKTISKQRYQLIIILHKFDINTIKKIFLNFVSFIQYNNFTAYSQSIDKDNKIIKYKFITAKHDSEGFICDLDFIASA